MPPFSGLRGFPQGRRFKQWTGDDSKGLMRVSDVVNCTWFIYQSVLQIYLPAIVGHLPTDIIKCFHYFLEFCYLVCRSVIDESCSKEINNAMANFHTYRDIFLQSGVLLESGMSENKVKTRTHNPMLECLGPVVRSKTILVFVEVSSVVKTI